MKVYLDENLSPEVARVLRARGIDAVSAHARGRRRVPDRAELAFATGEGRALVTADVRDFSRLARDAIGANMAHAGIILVPSSFRGDEFQAIAEAIAKVISLYPAGLAGMVIFLRRA